jgi:hypothetical protein
MVENKFKVPQKTWREWGAEQRKLFNGTYDDILSVGTALFLHPVTVQRKLSDDEFRTIAWNAAWTAAMMLRGMATTYVETVHEGRTIAVDVVQRAARSG